MPYLVVSLHDLSEFGDLDLDALDGAQIVVENGQFVLVPPPVNGDLIDARYPSSVNADTVDAGGPSTVNADTIDAGSI